jgi:glycosyltransferase involved in cell wall biosynthesis
VDWQTFFGSANLETIERLCGARMKQLGCATPPAQAIPVVNWAPAMSSARPNVAPKPSILIVTPFYEGAGGVAVAVRQLSQEFERAGHPVFILTRGPSVSVRYAGQHVYRVRLRKPHLTLRSWGACLLFLPLTLFSLWRLVVHKRVGVVLIQYASPSHFYFGLLRKFSRARLFVTFQGSDAHSIVTRDRSELWCLNALLAAADGVTAVAGSLLAKVRATVPGMTGRVAIIPNGAPMMHSSPTMHSPPEDYAITVGLLIRRKGMDVLIKALALLRSRGVEQRLMIVGAGEEHDSLVALAREQRVDDLVVFAGVKPHDEVLKLIQRSRFFVLASRAEGLPLVVVEAMMCGRAVVATRVDGVPDIVTNGSTGLLVEPEVPEALADAMERLVSDAALRERLAKAGRRMAERFRWSEIAGQYMKFFGMIADGQPRSAELKEDGASGPATDGAQDTAPTSMRKDTGPGPGPTEFDVRDR